MDHINDAFTPVLVENERLRMCFLKARRDRSLRHRYSDCFALLVAACALWAAPAAAQGRVEARYEASLSGVLIGKGDWLIDVGDDQYSMTAKGASAGLLKLATTGSGTTVTQGRIVNGQPVPGSYFVKYETDKKHETIRMSLGAGGIKDLTIDPEPPVNPERLPVTDAHKKNAVDPMTGSILRVSGNGDPVSREACNAAFPIFDGRMRYDLQLEFKRMDVSRAEKGYRGPVVVCAVYFTPVSGYIPGRYTIKYLAAQRNMEVWFAPIAGTRMLVPYKMVVPTTLGTATLEATQFITTPTPSRALLRTQ